MYISDAVLISETELYHILLRMRVKITFVLILQCTEGENYYCADTVLFWG